jgi:hypothetical protein
MLKLAKDFYITSIDYDYAWNSHVFDKEIRFCFRYKNYKVELIVSFSSRGITKEDNLPIINFGYGVTIQKWSNKAQDWQLLDDVDELNGKSTKKYFDSKEAREIVLRFVERAIQKYLKKNHPAIIIRGALSEIKLNLPRYKRLDKIFSQYYTKKEFDINRYDSLYHLCINYKKDENKVIWAYCKKEWYFDQLNEVIKA